MRINIGEKKSKDLRFVFSRWPYELLRPRQLKEWQKRSSFTTVFFLDKSPRFLEANGTAALASVLIMKERRNDAKHEGVLLDKMRGRQRDKSGGRGQFLVSTRRLRRLYVVQITHQIN